MHPRRMRRIRVPEIISPGKLCNTCVPEATNACKSCDIRLSEAINPRQLHSARVSKAISLNTLCNICVPDAIQPLQLN
eukprot:1681833-Pyramimonas_sp.AAC.1